MLSFDVMVSARVRKLLKSAEKIFQVVSLTTWLSLRMIRSETSFSAAKAALDMQMSVSQSVSLSVSQSICNAYLFSNLLVYFIIANRTEMKLKHSLSIT